jgi:molybdopterin-guanine dinucleotide biosynthesis protein A
MAGTTQAEPFSVAILAGGFGTRLGQDKASAGIAGRPLLHWMVEAVAGLTDDLLILHRADQELVDVPAGVTWRPVVDRRAESGPLAGLEAGLHASRHDLMVAVATDMPLVRPELLRAIAAACDGYAAVMPVLRGVAQPLCAAYRRSALPVIAAQLEEGDGRIRYIMPKLHGRTLAESEVTAYDPTLESFTNVNRPDDLARVGEILAKRSAAAPASYPNGEPI